MSPAEPQSGNCVVSVAERSMGHSGRAALDSVVVGIADRPLVRRTAQV